MKRKISRIAWVLLLAVVFVTSCTVQKRKYTEGFYTHRHTSSQKQEHSALKQKAIHKVASPIVSNGTYKNQEEDISLNGQALNLKPEVSFESKSKFNKPAFAEDSCDIIVLKSGIRIKAKVKEITEEVIKYKKCDFEEGPLYTQSKKDVSEIEYANGTKETVQYDAPQKSTNQNFSAEGNERGKKVEALGVVGLVLSIIGLFVAGILLGLSGIVLGIRSLQKINTQPEKYRNKKGYAYWSIGVGIVAVLGAVLVLLLI